MYNACYGGFCLSDKAFKLYIEKKGWTPVKLEKKYSWDSEWGCEENPELYDGDIDRDDQALVAVVEELGSETASGDCANLVVGYVDKGTAYCIEEYDGRESLRFSYDDWSFAE